MAHERPKIPIFFSRAFSARFLTHKHQKTRIFLARAFSARNSHSQLIRGVWEGRSNKAFGSIFVRRSVFVMFLAFLRNGFAQFLILKCQKFHIFFARAFGTRETRFHMFNRRREQNLGIREPNLLMQRSGLFCLPSQCWCSCHKICYLKMSVSQFFFARDTFFFDILLRAHAKRRHS